MTTLTQALSIEKTTNLRDASFSSYLNRSEEAFLQKLVESSKIPHSPITIQQENIYVAKKKSEDGEIGVFGAEKYFNEKIDEVNFDPRHTKNQAVKIQVRTPSVHSVCSWNSQSALLQSSHKNLVHTSKGSKRRHGKSLFSTLGCKCTCGDKDSVDIDYRTNESFLKKNVREEVDLERINIKSRMNLRVMEEMQMKKIDDFGIGLKKEDGFTFPIVKSKQEIFETRLVFQESEEEKKRKSLDVFGSPILEKRKESISLERKLDLFTLDRNPKGEEIDFPSGAYGNFDAYESDASSDLFEIESFSTANNSNPFLLRQASNTSSCVTPTTCYAPSEVSIDWSVVTASAADFSTVSDFEYTKTKSSFRKPENAKRMSPTGKGKEVDQKKRSGILSGCKSQKSVRVAGDAYVINGKQATDTRTKHNS